MTSIKFWVQTLLLSSLLFFSFGCTKDDDNDNKIEIVGAGLNITELNISNLYNHALTFAITDTNSTRTDTYHEHGIVSTIHENNTSTATHTVTDTTINHTSSTTDHSIDTGNGVLTVGQTYTLQTTPTTTVPAVLQTIEVVNNQKASLMAMGLDVNDAVYLITNHKEDVDVVLAKRDRIFKDLHLDNSMFVDSRDTDSIIFDGVQAGGQNITWNVSQINAFKKMYGRFAFVVNSPKFINAFNNNIRLLDPTYQGVAPSIPYPSNYDEFKAAANTALSNYGNHYKFFLTTRHSGLAYGIQGLKLQLETEMFTAQSKAHNTEGLILHEITHTWGYAHAYNDARTTLIANNIPYYVQFITAYDAQSPGTAVQNGQLTIPAGAPDALNTIYFGAD